MKESHSTQGPDAIHKPIRFLVDPLKRFMLIEAADGGILLLAALVALGIANSPLGASYIAFWQKDLGFVVGNTTVRMPLQLWINDGLMAVFFFVVGLETKHAVLPLAGAIGGMAVPAGLYLFQQWGTAGQHGWDDTTNRLNGL